MSGKDFIGILKFQGIIQLKFKNHPDIAGFGLCISSNHFEDQDEIPSVQRKFSNMSFIPSTYITPITSNLQSLSNHFWLRTRVQLNSKWVNRIYQVDIGFDGSRCHLQDTQQFHFASHLEARNPLHIRMKPCLHICSLRLQRV